MRTAIQTKSLIKMQNTKRYQHEAAKAWGDKTKHMCFLQKKRKKTLFNAKFMHTANVMDKFKTGLELNLA